MAEDPAPPREPAPEASQLLVAGDEIWIKAKFMRVSHDGVYVQLPHPAGLPKSTESPYPLSGRFQLVIVDPAAVIAPLRIVDILRDYGQ